MLEWRSLKIGDITKNFDAKRVPIRERDREAGPYPYYGASGVVDYVEDYIFDGEFILIAEDGENLRSRKTPIAFPANGRFWVNNHAHIVQGNELSETKFIGYLIESLDVSGYLTGSTIPKLTQANLNDIPVVVPPRSDQKAIAHILGTLDDKIELNRKMNETLEEIAKAIFKSWFVDFDPVRAKMEGRPTGLPDDIAALFPDRLVDSEIGEIPEGWKLEAIYSLAQFINGAAYKKFEPNKEGHGLPIIKIAELKSGITDQTGFSTVAMDKKYLIQKKDILFSWSGNPDTSIDTFIWQGEDGWLNQHIFRVIPREDVSRAFLLQLLKNKKPVFTEIARNKQTTGLGHVTVRDLKELKIAIPTMAEFKIALETLGSIQGRVFLGCQENICLADLRDTLLPKLISGELQVPDAEKFLEEAGI